MRKTIILLALIAMTTTTAMSATKAIAKHVLLIGLDGWGLTACPKHTTFPTCKVSCTTDATL